MFLILPSSPAIHSTIAAPSTNRVARPLSSLPRLPSCQILSNMIIPDHTELKLNLFCRIAILLLVEAPSVAIYLPTGRTFRLGIPANCQNYCQSIENILWSVASLPCNRWSY